MVNNKYKKHQCPCCEYFTLNNKANNTFQICPVCYWEDDGVQMLDPTYIGGANAVSLIVNSSDIDHPISIQSDQVISV
ncbi:CPCC family cysteine-rich protein [Chryseobacterium indoltheticum]|uniref:CPCC family cysteine-rich protein n=1 Tax=Chryseobacterium indoltheticum TaxID=254 RepID=UPI0019148E28|nr:CPCC family cysteine-rich protein [Chryseobacterium indoltheticum]QQQ28089.1 hypothetical protein JJL46_18780 [Chryseobacterium indoltheticum]